MHSAIQILKSDFKLPIDVATPHGHDTCVLQVMQEVCNLALTDDQYIVEICKLANIGRQAIHEPTLRQKHMPKYVFGYLAQNVLNSYLKRTDMSDDIVDIYRKSVDQARKYIDTHSWVFATGEDPNAPPKLDANGNIQPKKGDKKVMALKLYNEFKSQNLSRKEWIALLVKEVGLTPAGASTYYSNLKSGLYS